MKGKSPKSVHGIPETILEIRLPSVGTDFTLVSIISIHFSQALLFVVICRFMS